MELKGYTVDMRQMFCNNHLHGAGLLEENTQNSEKNKYRYEKFHWHETFQTLEIYNYRDKQIVGIIIFSLV